MKVFYGTTTAQHPPHPHLHRPLLVIGQHLFVFCFLAVCLPCTAGLQPIFIGDNSKETITATVQTTQPYITTTLFGFADFTVTKDNTVIHYKPTSVASSSSATTGISISQSVRIVVNTVVSTDDGKDPQNKDGQPKPVMDIRPTAAQALHITSTVSAPLGIGKEPNALGTPPATSRPEKRKVDPSGFIFQDDRIVGHSKDVPPSGASPAVVEPSLQQSHADNPLHDSGEANVQIAEHKPEKAGAVVAHNHEKQHNVQTSSGQPLPTGLVTMMGGTVVENGQTTVHETRVIGTYIDGTYAQILQSTSKIFEDKIEASKAKFTIQATGSLPTVISTAPLDMATPILRSNTAQLSPTPASISKKPTSNNWPSLKSRPPYSGIVRNKGSSSFDDKLRSNRDPSPSATTKSPKPTLAVRSRTSKNFLSSLAAQRSRLVSQRASRKPVSNEIQLKTISPDAKSSLSLATVTPSTVILDSVENKDNSKLNKGKSANRGNNGKRKSSRSRSTIRAKSSNLRNRNSADNNAIKPTRSYSRFTYTPNPSKYNPRRRLRLTKSERKPDKISTESSGSGESLEARIIEMTSSTSLSELMTTITTELTQFYGPEGSERSLVFTTTFERPITSETATAISEESGSLEKEDSDEEIVPSQPTQAVATATATTADGKEPADSNEDSTESINTKATPPLKEVQDRALTEEPTPPVPLSTITEAFTTTETVTRASLLPIFDGKSTAYFTLTQSYYVTKIVHALKTVPPKELLPFVIPSKDGRIPSNAKNEVGSDLNVAESEAQEDSVPIGSNSEEGGRDDPLLSNADILGLLNISDSNDVVAVKSNNQLQDTTAAETPPPTSPMPPIPPPGYGGNPYFNPFLNPLAYLGMGMPPPYGAERIITTSKPVYVTETIYGTKILPIWDGIRTSYHTTKAPSSTVVKTSYETYTTQMAPNAMPYANNPFPQPVQTITTTATVITTETLTSTQVLKLMYDGYKTSYRTLLSTTETVKTITTATVTTVPYGAFPFYG